MSDLFLIPKPKRSHSGMYYLAKRWDGGEKVIALKTASLFEAKRHFDREIRWLRNNGWCVVKTAQNGDVQLKQGNKHVTVQLVRYRHSLN